MSESVRSHRRQPTRLPGPWDSPGKNTGVGCHFLLQSMKVKSEREVTQSCPTLSDPMDCSPPGSSPSMGFSRPEYWSGVPLPSPRSILGQFNYSIGCGTQVAVLKIPQVIPRGAGFENHCFKFSKGLQNVESKAPKGLQATLA